MSGFWRDFLAAFTGRVPAAPRPAEERLRADLVSIRRWCLGIAAKAESQQSTDLAATAPRIAEEIDRALVGEPLAYSGHEPDPEVRELIEWLRNKDAAP